MAGILDSKERVMDFYITQEGKRQAGFGELRVKFASFTDYHTFYETSGSLTQPELAADASGRIFFEAYSRYQDVIVPELEAGYSLRPFRTADFEVAGRTIASGTFQVGFIDRLNVLTGSDLPLATEEILTGVLQNFTNQQIIGSIDEYSFSNDFSVSLSSTGFTPPGNASPKTSAFVVDERTEYFRSQEKLGTNGVAQLENLPSIFNDRRFSRFPNFLYLPPENAPKPGERKGNTLADYPRLDEKPILSLDEIMDFLKGKQKTEIQFNATSRFNNLVYQFFEGSRLGIDKLSIVDFGKFDDEIPGSPDSLLSPGRRVFFVGKMRRDASGAETFLCLFTVIID
jgi:hypothetical protein